MWWTILRWVLIGVAGLWLLGALSLVAARWIDPPTTAVHIQRRVQVVRANPYHERYRFIPLQQIAPDLQHAVIAAEDARFYQHHGFDWHEIQIAAEDDMEGGRTRGASTITQQLVKNLFFGTGRSVLRKGAEASLVPVAEVVLGKQRILEIYVNVVEWGPGVYGARRGVPVLLPIRGPECRAGSGSTARSDSAGSAAATSGAHESLQRSDSGAHAADEVVVRPLAPNGVQDVFTIQ